MKLAGSGLVLPLRAVQALFSLIVMGLCGYVANWYNHDTLTTSPSQVNFLIFAAVWSLVSIAYLEVVPRFAPKASNPLIGMGMELSNVIFWFSGFIALGVFLGRLLFCRGTVCGSAQAGTVFASFLFLLWAATAALKAKDTLKSGFRRPSSGSGASGSTAAPPPVTKETLA